ncbi:MAG TPA: hypothetical protein VEB21_06385 [Terriglobales bacterium]|nr:hypothetical protein [Terriglobales bacterium]
MRLPMRRRNNDGDQLVDCRDPDCAAAAVCIAPVPSASTAGMAMLIGALSLLGLLALRHQSPAWRRR